MVSPRRTARSSQGAPTLTVGSDIALQHSFEANKIYRCKSMGSKCLCAHTDWCLHVQSRNSPGSWCSSATSVVTLFALRTPKPLMINSACRASGSCISPDLCASRRFGRERPGDPRIAEVRGGLARAGGLFALPEVARVRGRPRRGASARLRRVPLLRCRDGLFLGCGRPAAAARGRDTERPRPR